MHYNGFPAAEINGGPAPGVSSSQAQEAIAGILDARLPRGMAYEWTELAYQEKLAGNTMLLIFPLCVLLVYVVLAAQYESWSLPLSVILIVPMTILSAIAGVWLTGGDNNVFTQISFLVLAGLACKNAILIVEFAKQREEEGEDRVTAILDACRVRLRPVLMTSVAFIMGVVPLVFATGRGLRDPARDGRRRVRRHARRHRVRPVPDAGVLHRRRARGRRVVAATVGARAGPSVPSPRRDTDMMVARSR